MNRGYDYSPFFYKKGRFFNPHIENIKRSLKDLAMWQLGCYRETEEALPPHQAPYAPPHASRGEALVEWINHSTFLVQSERRVILTDPIWSQRCSPLSWIGPKRLHPPGRTIHSLPAVDIVLISHDHYDHLDCSTVDWLHKTFPKIVWVVPLGLKAWFRRRKISRIVEMKWWESITLPNKGHDTPLQICAVPSQHYSGRKSWCGNQSLWNGYIVEFPLSSGRNKKMYFVGDTGYNPYDFTAIGKHFAPIDLSLIPIGAYSPRDFMAPVHISPREAVSIHQEVGSQFSLGMHWNTFPLSEEGRENPSLELSFACRRQNLSPEAFCTLSPGVSISW
ncbi:MAG: MBL fold metallo-hydrolase [Chlamydiota bacterium]|nr:MBL fold metallo-hydrolase [Chlamydiota bacterium]